MSALGEAFFPTDRAFVVRSPVDADTATSRLFATIDRPQPWATAAPGRVMGTVSGRRLDA